jgi:hypothetical protein
MFVLTPAAGPWGDDADEDGDASLRLAVISAELGDVEPWPSQAVITTEPIMLVAMRRLRRIIAASLIIAERGGQKEAGAGSRASNTNAPQCPFFTQ